MGKLKRMSSPGIAYLFKTAASIRSTQIAANDFRDEDQRKRRHLIVRDCTDAIKIDEWACQCRHHDPANARAQFRFMQSISLWYRRSGSSQVRLG